jgi:DNA-binding transcriptional regulator of glucitol operon
VRRLLLSPRWILWSLLALGAVVTCLWLAAWQWQRAGSAMGSALNIGYGLQWPVFAVFFAVMWWRLLRMELRDLQSAPDAAKDAEAGPPGTARRDPAPAPASRLTDDVSMFGPRPAAARPAAVDEDSALAAYNRMLAELARNEDR